MRDLLASDDTARMLEALQALGVGVESLGARRGASAVAAGVSRCGGPSYSSAMRALRSAR